MPITRPTLTYFTDIGVRDGSSQTAVLGLGEVSTTRHVVVKWGEAQQAAQSLLGYSRITPGSGGRLERLLPLWHPLDPSLIPVRVALERNHQFLKGLGANLNVPGSLTNTLSDGSVGSVYKKVCLRIEYQRAMFDLKEDADTPRDAEAGRYVDWGVPEPVTNAMTTPGHLLHYTVPPGQTPPALWQGQTSFGLSFNVPRIETGFRLAVRWLRLPAPLWQPLTPGPLVQRLVGDPHGSPPQRPYIGTVNKTQFGPYKPGQLLLEGWSVERRPAPFVLYTGTQNNPPGYLSPAVEFDFVYNMAYRPYGHNFVYFNDYRAPGQTGPTGSQYCYVSRTKTYHAPGSVPPNDSLFDEADFNDLFKVYAL